MSEHQPYLAAAVLATAILFLVGATAPSPPTRFEYTCLPKISRPWEQADLEKMNELGAKGWELVQQLAVPHDDVFCFKRPLR